MAATQSQIDEILKLLQNQHRQQQPQQQDMQQAQLYAFHNQMQPNPVYLPYPANVQPHNPTAFHQRHGLAGQTDAHPRAPVPHCESQMDYDSLTQEQRRKIAMAYNREEAEKQAIAQKEQERMLESIKASIKDALKEQNPKSATLESQSKQYETLRILADTPYKRAVHTRGSESTDNDIARFLRELRKLRELTKELSSRRVVEKQNLINPNQSPGNQTVDMEAENTSHVTTPTVVGEHSLVTAKQQAGYASVAQAEAGRSTGDSVSDFIFRS
ncbi:NAD+ diphosphatase [Sarotherodon galilaeus]